MTTGIRVIWPDDDGGIDEIEYFYGIDVDDLDDIPEFTRKLTSVQAVWPQPQYDGRLVEYAVDARCKSNLPDEVRVVVTYEEKKNQNIVKIIEEQDEGNRPKQAVISFSEFT